MVAIAERPTEEQILESRHSIIIRFGGESGEGVKSTGELLTQVAARAGFEVLTFQTYPAEIKGGHSIYQVRLSSEQLYTEGDRLDVLLAFNQEGYDKSYEELSADGLLLFDEGNVTDFHYPQQGKRHVALPLTRLAKEELKFELGKNVVGVGMLSGLFGFDVEPINRLITEKFTRKGEDVVAKNKKAFEVGYRYIEEIFPDRVNYHIQTPATQRADTIIVGGNQNLSMGALAGRCTHIFGYPITPASDILEFLAAELPKVGGVAIQAEDEIASMGMVLGASYTGRRAMTCTSGPGLSLMVEMLGLSGMAELPAVIVNVQRAGPSTGMPTKHEQGDLNMAVYAGHGEVPRIVLAPVSVDDCFWRAIDAFNLAEAYQVPVILLSDTVLAVRTESITRPDLSKIKIVPRLTFDPQDSLNGKNGETLNPNQNANTDVSATGNASESGSIDNSAAGGTPGATPEVIANTAGSELSRAANVQNDAKKVNDGEGDEVDLEIAARRGYELYQRYAITENGVSPMSIPGQAGGQYTSTGLEHNEFSRPRYDVASHTKMTDKRARKLAAAVKEAPAPYRVGDPTAEIGVLTWGSTAGVAHEAMDMAAKLGIKVDVIAPRMIWPIPTAQLDDFIASKRVVIIPECNYAGQFANLLNTHYRRDFVRINVYGGAPIRSSEILAEIQKANNQH